MPANPTHHLVLIGKVQDEQIDLVRAKLRAGAYRLVAGRDDVEAVLEELAAQVAPDPPACSLDLIGHADPHGLLHLGDWVIDENAATYFKNALRALLATLRVTQIRLLGCSTATERRGWAVICEIAAAVGDAVEVFGTRRVVDASDYSADGFIGIDAITDAGARVGARNMLPTILDVPI